MISERYFIVVVATLCSCCIVGQLLCEAKFTLGERNEIVDLHNMLRASVTPPASNMEKMVWNEELALFAEAFAAKCNAEHSPDQNPRSLTFDRISRNFFLLSDVVEPRKQVNYSLVIHTWFGESSGYNYDENTCSGLSCSNYSQMVYSGSNQIGCGTFYCDRPVRFINLTGNFIVCNYAPGMILEERPYQTGVPCTRCPSGTSCGSNNNLCSFQVAENPQFRVTLPSGHMFCYNIQGEQDRIYNLISSQLFEMNAVFHMDPLNSSISWMDSIGISVFHKGNDKTQIKFSASSWDMSIGDSVSLTASTLDKITVTQGRLRISPSYPKEDPTVFPSIEVYFDEFEFDFSIHYTKVVYEDHKIFRLSLFWRSIGAIPSDAHGIVGQLLQDGVSIDEEGEKLILPDHSSVSVTKIPAWKLPRDVDSERLDRRCWSTTNKMIESEDVLKGSSIDYQVNNVFSTGFKFGGL